MVQIPLQVGGQGQRKGNKVANSFQTASVVNPLLEQPCDWWIKVALHYWMTNFLAFIAFLTEEPTCLQISSVYKHPQCSTLLSPTPVLFLILYRSCVQSVTDVQPETLRLPFLRHIKWQICSEYCLLLSPWPFILMDALKRWKETSAAAVCGSRLKKKYILFFLFSSGERSFNEKWKLKKKKSTSSQSSN